MNSPNITLVDVIDGLRAEGLLPDDANSRATELVESLGSVQPWYIRTMVGFGAWLASLLLISFVAGISLAADGGYIFVGLGLIAGAVVLRRRSDNDFMVQSSLAISLAGQGVLAYGIQKLNLGSDVEFMLAVVAIVSAVLFVIFPDRIHRVLMVLSVASSVTVLIYHWELNAIIPFLGPALAAALIFLHQRQMLFVFTGWGEMVRPLMAGLMLSAFGCLLISTIYILPELGVDYAFYPRPWISTVLLGALFIYLGSEIWPTVAAGAVKIAIPLAYLLMAIVVMAAWAVPGLLLALIVVMLGASSGNRIQVGAGVAFLVVFLAAYFYGIQVTMLTKSVTLIATGFAILLARWLVLWLMSDSSREGGRHV